MTAAALLTLASALVAFAPMLADAEARALAARIAQSAVIGFAAGGAARHVFPDGGAACLALALCFCAWFSIMWAALCDLAGSLRATRWHRRVAWHLFSQPVLFAAWLGFAAVALLAGALVTFGEWLGELSQSMHRGLFVLKSKLPANR